MTDASEELLKARVALQGVHDGVHGKVNDAIHMLIEGAPNIAQRVALAAESKLHSGRIKRRDVPREGGAAGAMAADEVPTGSR